MVRLAHVRSCACACSSLFSRASEAAASLGEEKKRTLSVSRNPVYVRTRFVPPEAPIRPSQPSAGSSANADKRTLSPPLSINVQSVRSNRRLWGGYGPWKISVTASRATGFNEWSRSPSTTIRGTPPIVLSVTFMKLSVRIGPHLHSVFYSQLGRRRIPRAESGSYRRGLVTMVGAASAHQYHDPVCRERKTPVCLSAGALRFS